VRLKTYGLQSFLKSRGLTAQFSSEFMLLSALMSLRAGWRASSVLLLVLALPSLRAQAPEVAGTMPEDYLPGLKTILVTALKQAPQTIAKEIELTQATARLAVANAPRLPSVGGYLNYASNETATTTNTNNRTRDNGGFYNFGVTQALFHWGALKNESEKARIGVLIAQKSYNEAYRALAVTLRRSYLELIVKKSQLVQLRFERDLVGTELALAKLKLQDGLLAEGDIAGRTLNFEDVNLRVDRVEVEFSILRRAFGRLAGMPDPTEAAIPDEVPKPTYAAAAATALLNGLVREGARGTFQAQVSELRVREADLNYRIARVRLLPKFKAGANYSLENTTNASATSVTQQGVSRQTFSVGADWTIFDGFATRGAKLDALANKRLRERDLQMATEASIDGAQALADQLRLDARTMDQADLRLALAAAQVRKFEEEATLGNLSQNSVDGAVNGVKETAVASAAARASYFARWSEFVSLTSVDPVLNQLPARHDREKR
jgi:outer membrane protein TolC